MPATTSNAMPAAAANSTTATPAPAPGLTGRVDYYDCLQIHRAADLHDIQNAFRRLVLQHHPDRSKHTVGVAAAAHVGGLAAAVSDPAIYAHLCEAYDVLHNPLTRAIYDLFGHDGLEHGVPEFEGKPGFAAYKYHGDPNRSFNEFFGSNNVFLEIFKEHLYDPKTGTQRVGYGSLRPDIIHHAPIHRAVSITLEEAYSGIIKRVPWTRRVLETGSTDKFHQRDEMLTLAFQPGTKHGTKLVFSEFGDQAPNTRAADVVFVVQIDAHPVFERDSEDNLVYTHTVSLEEALTGSIVKLTMLDGSALDIPVYEVMHPFYVKRVPGHGMPVLGQAADGAATATAASTASAPRRGDLLIRFKVQFPTYLNPKQKTKIHEALGGAK
ncbi:hypothetical protein AMAG_01585 [Allomyces macrogynus ATCC 38327]|uniref:J domain-containing protein n=1 Tax=Allomyces macrogynus (strain ATCC 38327) TaxID=578462 RepID=A0A0L0S049_ALLM3|nr:hypothetical protein AMAG_01585 [Allomyces macrogynus ATCC 38327]|eukprot:KNE55704.1 hypothetical protein AMAG_01585 [Allomyces macrogynus ATCC 38327]